MSSPSTCSRCGSPALPDESGLCTGCRLIDQLALNDEDAAVIGPTLLMGAPLYFDRQGNPISLLRWGELSSRADDYARVAGDYVGDVWVSTVWLGIDHRFTFDRVGLPPIIFETMVFGLDDDDRPCMRYCTEAEALEGHARTVADVQAGRRIWFARGGDSLEGGLPWDLAQEPCPICGDAWHGLDHPQSGCPGEFASDVEIKEWKRRRL